MPPATFTEFLYSLKKIIHRNTIGKFNQFSSYIYSVFLLVAWQIILYYKSKTETEPMRWIAVRCTCQAILFLDRQRELSFLKQLKPFYPYIIPSQKKHTYTFGFSFSTCSFHFSSLDSKLRWR